MRGFTLTQPWASLVAVGAKKVETRSWRSNYTGPIAIHAAKGYPADARYFASTLRTQGLLVGTLPVSAIVAIATLSGCRLTEDVAHQLTPEERFLGDYSPGRWAWFLSDIEALKEPLFCGGALGLWRVSPEIMEQLARALV